ncbi:uncharacterized protein A4U43_C06F18280 [Asparagus officinalis]|uniref:Uncharacterized protein n=1 Tax=Asparagus officinalis TaxID=4686 RepID=A0A5P1ER29_ASPOF|nr:uncharacterized protein A4U43_C06F18280 [Asparagus officinalis]
MAVMAMVAMWAAWARDDEVAKEEEEDMERMIVRRCGRMRRKPMREGGDGGRVCGGTDEDVVCEEEEFIDGVHEHVQPTPTRSAPHLLTPTLRPSTRLRRAAASASARTATSSSQSAGAPMMAADEPLLRRRMLPLRGGPASGAGDAVRGDSAAGILTTDGGTRVSGKPPKGSMKWKEFLGIKKPAASKNCVRESAEVSS